MSVLKCETCRFLRTGPSPETSYCTSPEVNTEFYGIKFAATSLPKAREICNKEGDGIFVHFEPKTPGNGAAFGESRREFELDRLGQTGQDNAAAFKAAT